MVVSDPFLSISPLYFPLQRLHSQVASSFRMSILLEKYTLFLPVVTEKCLELAFVRPAWVVCHPDRLLCCEGKRYRRMGHDDQPGLGHLSAASAPRGWEVTPKERWEHLPDEEGILLGQPNNRATQGLDTFGRERVELRKLVNCHS